MQKAPVLKGSGLAPIDDGAANVHVFGKNLEDRVIACQEEEEEETTTSSKKEVLEESRGDDVESIKKRKFETITGEEDEETAFQGDFKLFTWDISTSNWIEKGRGQLKLNDKLHPDGRKSRLIMRTAGTYRIILNVAIQHPTFRVIANTKTNIRFTDSQNVWAASGSNAMQLGDLIDQRLKADAINRKLELKRQESEPQEEKINERNNKVGDEKKEEVDQKDEKVEGESGKAGEQEGEVNDKSNNTNENCDRVDSPSQKEEEKEKDHQNNKSEGQEEEAEKEKEDQPEEVEEPSKKIDSPTGKEVEDQSARAEDQSDKVVEELKVPTSEEVQDESSKNESRNEDRDCEQHEAKKRKAE